MPSLAAETEQVSQCQHHQGAGKAPGPAGAGTSPGHSGDTFRHRPRPAHCHQPPGTPRDRGVQGAPGGILQLTSQVESTRFSDGPSV